jgi:translocation and assembly module TamB
MGAIDPDIPPPPPPRRRRRWPWITLAVFVALLAVLCAGVYWLVATPGGAQLVFSRVATMLGEGTKFEGVEGQLGGTLRIKAIHIDRPDLYVHIDDVEIDSSPRFFGGSLIVHRLYARNVEVRTVSSGAAAAVPKSFAPPYAVILEDGRVGTLRLGKKGGTPDNDLVLRDIAVKGEGDKSRWKIDQAAVVTEYGTLKIAGTLGNATPFPLDATGTFAGTFQERAFRIAAKVRGTLKEMVADVDADVGGTRATGNVVLEPFASVLVKTLTVNARDLDLAQVGAQLPHTRLTVEAKLVPDGKAFAGPVRITNAEPGTWDQKRLPFTTATARVVASKEKVDIHDLAVALLGGGSAAGNATLRGGTVEADLRVADVDLAALQAGLQKTKVTGRVTAAGNHDGQRFDVALKDPRFEIEGRAAIAGERLEVESARIRTGGGSVTAKGGMALAGRKEFRFEGKAEHFDPSAFLKTTKGDLNFTFVTSGSLADGIAGQAKLDIAPSTYAGLPAAGRVDISGDKRRIASADVDVTLGEARVSAKGSFGRTGDALDLTFRAPNLSVIGKAFGVALAGRAEGSARLTGTFQSPAGRIELTGANLVFPSNVYVHELALRAEAGTEPDSPIDASVQAKGVAIGKDTPPTPLAETASATLKGTRAAHRFEFDAKMARDTTVKAALQGGLDPRAKSLSWNGRLESLAMTGRGAFALTAPASLTLAANRVELGDALLKGEWGEARLALTRWTPESIELKGATPGIMIQNLARSLRLGTVPRSNLVIAADWDIRAAQTFEGSLHAHRLSGDLRVGEPPLALGLQELTLAVEAVKGRAQASLNIVGERIGRVQGEGSAMIVRGDTGWELAQSSPVQGKLVADIANLEALAPWLGADAKLGGQLAANVTVSGTGADPRLSGEARAENLVMREPQSGFELEQGQVAVRMNGRSLVIERFAARTPWHPSGPALERMRGVAVPAEGGTISAEGSIDLTAHTGAIRVRADKVPVTQLPTRFLAMSGEAKLEAGANGLMVTGDLKADAGWIGALPTAPPSVSEDVVVIRASQPAAAEEAARKEPIRLDARFNLGDRVYFQGRGLDTRLAGELRLVGEVGGTLRASGTISTVGGTYEGYGQKLAIERGVLTFSGPIDNPRLNVLALRKGLPVEAGVEILGTTTRPRVRLVSSPDVPEPEKLSWLVLGRGASDASPGDTSVLLAAASALLGGNNPGSDLTKKLGFDEVKIGRSDSGSVLGVLPQSTVAGRTGTASAADVVSVGKRLSRNLQLNYEQGLADAEGALKLTWRISRQFQLLARAGYLPGVDAVYRWTFK